MHSLFYYPYASLTDAQLPLLKVAAVWFDKLFILDPDGASWNTIGADEATREHLRQLATAGILEVVTPATVLDIYEAPLAEAIRRDMRDPEFLELCDAQTRATGKRRWTLALAKVPAAVRSDERLRHLMGDFSREVVRGSAEYRERTGATSTEYHEYAERGEAFDEYRERTEGVKAYRYADVPLALGEAIMVNHALFGGLLQAAATPITDDDFHTRALALKLRRSGEDPIVVRVRSDRARQHKLDLLAAAAFADPELRLPVLSAELPLAEILEYRQRNEAVLGQARDRLGWMARSIKATPWTKEFAEALEHETIPQIAEELNEARKARDAWLKTKRGKLAVSAAGIALGAAAAALSVFAAPLTPIALATAGLTLASGTVLPGAEWLLDWREGRQIAQENGLHYLLRT